MPKNTAASIITGANTICLCRRLLFYSKCNGFTVCLTYIYRYIANVYKSMINKRLITLTVVYSLPFASKAVFWAILYSNSFKIAQKTAFEAKGRLYTTVKVIQRLFITDLHSSRYIGIGEEKRP